MDIRRRIQTQSARLDPRHADEMRRFIQFLMIGGFVGLVNLFIVWLFTHQHRLPYILYITIATEFTIVLSFLLNDRIAFKSLTQRGHWWYIRCLRFHGAAAFGAVLTIAISLIAHHAMHLSPVAAQAVAIALVTMVNFSSIASGRIGACVMSRPWKLLRRFLSPSSHPDSMAGPNARTKRNTPRLPECVLCAITGNYW